MIYGHHRAKGAPALGALPGQEGPFGRWPEPEQVDATGTEAGPGEAAAVVPSPRNGSWQ